ncbi:hypothetical protein PLICRDRAFT_47475 [Plicaturopsis crispa FD-325 SS-3]|uniref:CCHC-type domain-containing protein n=1 Tax=Plicaturopsis crispa FD-325 SS-3 TaxID=944288 RepID=A0A0C9T108_PLICR|nr:hypothetical protein PLICRDRAFT_47475 [Plicaturopsis crispa FD-325 SS-3]
MSIQTGSSSLLAAIRALSDSNWFVWKKGMSMFLLANSAGGVLDGVVPKQEGLDGTLLPFIWSKIAPEWQFVEDAVGAVAAWKALQAHFEKSTMSNRLAARQALYSVVHDPQQPVSLYIQSLTAARAKLDALGVKIDDQEFKDVLLMRLDDSFDSLRTTILAQSPEPDLARISSLLTSSALSGSFASAVKGEESETALSSRSSRSRAKGESARSSSAPVDAKGFRWCDPTADGVCHRCGRSGHRAARCMFDVPSHIKDWVMSTASPPHSRSPTRPGRARVAADRSPSRSPSPHRSRRAAQSAGLASSSCRRSPSPAFPAFDFAYPSETAGNTNSPRLI